MKALVLLLTLSAPAFAENYSCSAVANPNRGFTEAFTVTVTPAETGGTVILITASQRRNLGPVAEAISVHKDIPGERVGFDKTLGFLNEEDVSGIAPADLSRVTHIEALRVNLPSEDEAIVYRLFAGEKQIGGSFLYSGWGTACTELPSGR